MLDHAFGTLGLHRIALAVFEFNERAIRAYTTCGFVIEGRARESIWRDGRWWDELSMSVLTSEWRAREGAGDGRGATAGAAVGRGAGDGAGAGGEPRDIRSGGKPRVASGAGWFGRRS